MSDANIHDDIVRSKSGDMVAYGRVVRETQAFALRLAHRLLGRTEEAEDVVQEAFIRVWNNLMKFDEHQKFTTWLYTIVSNLCMDHLRARQRQETRFVRMDPAAETGDPASPAGDAWSTNELAGIVVRIAQQLPPQQRLVFTLRDIEDLSVEEVGAITCLPARTIKANLYYARRAVRESLKTAYHITGV
jgi:RNA polymerase sigma-70 factor, ECF subfamily